MFKSWICFYDNRAISLIAKRSARITFPGRITANKSGKETN